MKKHETQIVDVFVEMTREDLLDLMKSNDIEVHQDSVIKIESVRNGNHSPRLTLKPNSGAVLKITFDAP